MHKVKTPQLHSVLLCLQLVEFCIAGDRAVSVQIPNTIYILSTKKSVQSNIITECANSFAEYIYIYFFNCLLGNPLVSQRIMNMQESTQWLHHGHCSTQSFVSHPSPKSHIVNEEKRYIQETKEWYSLSLPEVYVLKGSMLTSEKGELYQWTLVGHSTSLQLFQQMSFTYLSINHL